MKDIGDLSQHFNKPGQDISPWIFIPEDNIKEMSTSEHPGLLTVWQAGKGKDIKGILKEPIRIDDYSLPWEFELCLLPNWVTSVGWGDPKQQNYAVGLNVAVTFSDPSTWPKDRTIKPKDTRSFQLLMVHVGSSGEFSDGLPQFASESTLVYESQVLSRGGVAACGGISPEQYYVWGRGDLDSRANGDWKIPFPFPQNGLYRQQAIFICDVINPTRLKVGIRFEEWCGFELFTINCSEFGNITGIWEIGPVFSCDRWIPDVLCKQLPLRSEADIKKTRRVGNIWHPEDYHGFLKDSNVFLNPDIQKENDKGAGLNLYPEPVAPNPIHEFYVDYCVFMQGVYLGANCAPLEHQSDDFDIPGYFGNWVGSQQPFSAETHSNPGYLTISFRGPSQGCWFVQKAFCGIDLDYYKPPWEMEICFIADDAFPWNLHFHCRIANQDGQIVGYWQPGVQNYPDEKRHRFVNTPHKNGVIYDIYADTYPVKTIKIRDLIDIKFDPEVPEKILSSKPLCMLYQVIDKKHLRMGFRASPKDKWYLSEIKDVSDIVKGEIKAFDEPCWGSTIGRHWGLPPGSPVYQKLLIDYVHYRYGLSAK